MEMLLKIAFFPLSLLYGLVIWIRNTLFDFKILKSKEFKIPVISVGNITVGGTGKTPHTEYLIKLLKNEYKLALLSRGYKRKTRDFRIATENSNYEEIGDEPYQVKKKFPEISVAVDANRVNGIEKIMRNVPETDIILLDDAFQHRSVSPGVNILLIDYNRPIFNDSLLPMGRLREPASQKDRADIIIVSKTPENITAIEKRLYLKQVNARPYQTVFFTSLKYGGPVPIFDAKDKILFDFSDPTLSILLLTGIANPTPLIKEINTRYKEVTHLKFPDHYAYAKNDILSIVEKLNSLSGKNKIILTTEKDAARLHIFADAEIKPEFWYYIPIEIVFHEGEADAFNRQIIHYVQNNSKNSILYKE
jgi:tetraacyldisaccharide 4'-kinase